MLLLFFSTKIIPAPSLRHVADNCLQKYKQIWKWQGKKGKKCRKEVKASPQPSPKEREKYREENDSKIFAQ